jgi:hypothetical protein
MSSGRRKAMMATGNDGHSCGLRLGRAEASALLWGPKKHVFGDGYLAASFAMDPGY